jgi:ubiquinone biosynthesis protein
VLEAELGGPVSTAFGEFDWRPLASASIAQTDRARLHSGEPVVVKVQRLDMAYIMERDLAALARLADLAERRTRLGRGFRSGEILAHFARSLRAELDFLLEANAMADMAAVLDPESGVRILKVLVATRRVTALT